MKIRFLAFTFWLCLISLAQAQNISVASFVLDPNDLTANLEGTTVYDQNGQKCALIRIQTTQKGFSFDVGALGVQKVDDTKVGEIWLYVPEGVKRLTMRHPQLGSLLNYPFPIAIVGSKTYVMQLTTANVHTVVEEAVTQQYVVFRVSPPEAIVEFDGDIIDLNEGVGTKFKSFGTYGYTAQATLYHPQTGQVTVNDPDKKHEVKIDLRPAFGYIEVPAEGKLAGAKVFIDNAYKGTVPFRSERLASGNHQVRLVRQMYSPVSENVAVKDGETTRFAPALSADFARVTLRVEGNAEIWVNEERKGAGTWTGELATGDYKIECRLASHRTATKQLSVQPALDGQTIDLAAPTPIYGRLNVTSTPIDADIYLDGQKVGTTPMMLPKCLIGQHTVRISKAGHSDFAKTIALAEGATEEISARLESGKPVAISAPEGADIYVDGAKVGTTRFEGALAFGSHTAYAMQGGKKSGEKAINVSMQGGAVPAVTLTYFEFKDEPLTFNVNGVSFTMMPVKGGTFQMGSNDGDGDERPIHSVTLSDYYIGQTEVTQELWQAVMGSNPAEFEKGPTLPVYYVSWNDCQEFISKLNRLTGGRFRLPTEAEWEYAARGGNKSRGYKYSGSDDLDIVAWYDDNSGNKVHPVASKLPNELGLYDMSGNMYEWCSDRYGDYSSSPQTNPSGPSSGSNRVVRGGCYFSDESYSRSANRSDDFPTGRFRYGGFRLAY
ncbi:MAG: SUMF1/EgtB/PvdO family nonheme iron enzyme [Bacteroidales bacterium]|nr:SUMF1/EgtB/PvdO family nonheme iron enzyme [Bacteroidales bacterium]